MANSDYSQTGAGTFCALIVLDTPVGRLDDTFSYTEFNYQYPDPVSVGMAGMIDDEIVRVTEVLVGSFKVARGCADTLPAGHGVGALCWFFNTATGTDGREYSATQTIGVKVSPFTTGGGNVPVEAIAPDAVTFNWRFARPYPPAQMKVNNARWYEVQAVTEAAPNFSMTWVDRDRILQADQLLGHDDPTIGPEPGCTYTMRVYDSTGALRRTEIGLRNRAFNYQWPQIVHDMAGVQAGTVHLASTRNGLDSWQEYVMPFTVNAAGTLTSQYMPFDVSYMEAPYRQNLVNGNAATGNFFIGVAARPTDRMSDAVNVVVTVGAQSNNVVPYTPWATSDFRLPELETTLNVRTSSMFDGVPVKTDNIGKLALIDDEIVQIDGINDSGSAITIRRGCLDTVPQVHLAGARLWLFESAAGNDHTNVPAFQLPIIKFQPQVYGPEIPLSSLTTYGRAPNARSQRPYAPAQMVVNGRPWFEEAQATSGVPVVFRWARRNRVTQGTTIYDHTLDDVLPEDGQVTRLSFFYTTPSATPGQPAVEHELRSVDLVGNTYAYPYNLALIDGPIAGHATGVCGTVVIYVRVFAVMSGLSSWGVYTVPLRLPSYPCA